MEYVRVPEPHDDRRGLAHVPGGEPAGTLQPALNRALDREPELARRLTRARTSVRFEIDGDPDVVTLMLDRDPPVVRRGAGEPAEIEISLNGGQARALAAGGFPISTAAYAGEVRFRGPIRRFMEVDPILQTALAGDVPPARSARVPVAGAPRSESDADLLAIQTAGLEKSFGAHAVLAGVALEIPEGTIAVVLGPSGSGKSVLFQHLIGALEPERGEVRIRGGSLQGMSRSRLMRLRREVGVMYQDGALFSAMNLFDNVAFPLHEHTDLSDREIREVVEDRLHDVGLHDAAGLFPRELSGGMRKRAGLARALVLDPGILLCDEPDSGLDPVRTALIGDLLTDHHARGGGVTLVVTHDITLARQIADHVSVLWQGRIVASGLAENVFASEDEFVRQFLDGRVDGPLGMG